MHKIDEKLADVTARIAHTAQNAGRLATDVDLIAVSKTQDAPRIREAYKAGQHHFGENYLQEALQKQSQLTDCPGIHWHFIGPIQANKTRDIARHFSWVHSVDRAKIAERLNSQRPVDLPPLQVCLQINIDSETSKSGISPSDAADLARTVDKLPHLVLRGLMTIPAPTAGSSAFARLRKLLNELQSLGLKSPLDTLSMGMSADLELAIKEGATLVRVGTDIFGPRDATH